MNYNKIFNDISFNILPVFKRYREDIKNIKIDIKEDKTLLTQADIEIQNIIISIIKKYDPNANLIAEENGYINNTDKENNTWIIDPIDGTKQFADQNSKEFCSAVCIINNGYPIASMILLPEMGINSKPLQAVALAETKEILINGISIKQSQLKQTRFASTTRSSVTLPSKLEELLIKKGYKVKSKTTSQSIDLLRTAIDLSDYTAISDINFDIFYRENQKIWDGAPGICFNLIQGKNIVDLNNNKVLPFTNDIFNNHILKTVIIISDDSKELLFN